MPGQTQVQVERFYLCIGPVTPQDPQSELTNVARERGGRDGWSSWNIPRFLTDWVVSSFGRCRHIHPKMDSNKQPE